jgi:hypothetical protein
MMKNRSRHAGHWSQTDEIESCDVKTLESNSIRPSVYEFPHVTIVLVSKSNILCRVFACQFGIFWTRLCWWVRTLRIVTL